MRSPLDTDWPLLAPSPLTLTRPWPMRSSSARREPRPACASTLCRRSSMRGVLSSAVLSFSDRTFLVGVLLISELRLGDVAGLFVVGAGFGLGFGIGRELGKQGGVSHALRSREGGEVRTWPWGLV